MFRVGVGNFQSFAKTNVAVGIKKQYLCNETKTFKLAMKRQASSLLYFKRIAEIKPSR